MNKSEIRVPEIRKKSEGRNPKAEIRTAGSPQVCTQTEDEDDDEHEDDTLARQGTVKVGQSESPIKGGRRSAEFKSEIRSGDSGRV
jgi:hypothetical protein